jgi:hypothetical protein
MMSILIICYLRPEDLKTILTGFVGSNRRIYVFIDNAAAQHTEKNLEVLRVAQSFQSKMDIQILHFKENLGAGRAVPRAIDWIAGHENEFLILEDDCHISDAGIGFVEKFAHLLREDVALICATSPWDLPFQQTKSHHVTTSSYPLISGWATSALNWKDISFLVGAKPPFLKSIISAIKQPRKAMAIAYFLAAHIRVAKGNLDAWDCSVALGMLLKCRISLIPDVTTVTNTGRD